MSRWANYQKMDRADRRILLVASALLPIIAVMIRFVGFRHTFSVIRKFADAGSSAFETDEQSRSLIRIRKVVRIIKLKGLFRGNCLSRSLMLWVFLRRRQIPCKLIFGTRIRDGVFQAHAWVEKDFKPINAGPNVRKNYHVFDYDFESTKMQHAFSG